MNPREIARALSIGRVAVGLSLLAAPRWLAPLWVGRDGLRGASKLLTRAVGARDLALGAGTLATLAGDGAVAPWIRAAILADATDAIATFLERDEVPRLSRPLVYLMGGGAAIAGIAIQGSVDERTD